MLNKLLFLSLPLAVLALSGCSKLQPNNPAGSAASGKDGEASAKQAAQRRVQQACASPTTYDRLKVLAFEEAAKVRGGQANALDQLAAATVLRMDSPVPRSRDETLNITVCAGHMVFEVPPGAERFFNGQRRLEADVEYSIQQAADGSGQVYRMRGAEPIVYRLAAFDLPQQRQAQLQTEGATAQTAARQDVAEPPPVAPAQPAPRVVAAPQPQPPAPRPAAPATPPAIRPAPPAPAVTTRPVAARPSFNCSYARSRSERLVCGNADLARLDRRMSAVFFSALADADPDQRAELRRTRDRFLAYRNRCGNEACIADAYQGRIAEIEDIMRGRY